MEMALMFFNAFKRYTLILSLFWTFNVQAGFINDTLDVKYSSFFGAAFDSTATVGTGIEFSGKNLIHTYYLDFTENAFTLTVSKPSIRGNFTGIFKELKITGIDDAINNIVFDAANSSTFSKNPMIDFSQKGSITLSTLFYESANTPASALSHSFTWLVEFEPVAVNAPSVAVLFTLGLMLISVIKRSKN